MSPTTLILLGQRRRLLLPLLQAASACAIPHRVVLGPPATQRLQWSSTCTRHVTVDAGDAVAVLQALAALAHEDPHAVVAPADCEAACLLQRLGDRLPLATTPLARAQTTEMLDDKATFHRFCREQGLPVPESLVVDDRRDLSFGPLARELGVPFVVKPTRGSGSVGVVVVRSARDLEQHVLGDRRYPAGPVIVQRFVPGCDIDADLVAVDGRVQALAVHRVHGPTMAFVRHPALEAAAHALCAASGYSGPMNIDARLDADTGEVFLVESNPRFWASLVAPLACGMNFLRESLVVEAGATHVLAPGQVDTRHPLLRPAAWWPLLSDGGERGRLLRVLACDPYGLAVLGTQAPGIARRALGRGAAFAARLVLAGEERLAAH